MPVKAQITTDGELELSGNIDSSKPSVTNGLIAHFPLDGPGGTFDQVGGRQSTTNTETGVNLIEAMEKDWRDPTSWSSNSGMEWDEAEQALKITGYHNSWLTTPIWVDTTKHYQVSMEVKEVEQSSSGLYLGGLDLNELGERVTPNYDYTYASNAQPTTGVWTTYRVTRTGTGTISSGTRTSFDTEIGWTGTRTGLTGSLLTERYYYGGLFNYSSGGIMYIRNLSVVVVDTDTSNTNITDDGIDVVNTFSNLTSGKLVAFDDSRPSPLGQLDGWSITGIGNDNPRKYIVTDDITVSASTQYTFSALYWSDRNSYDDVYLEFTGTGYPEGTKYIQPFLNSHTSQLSGSSGSFDLGDGWKQYYGTFITTADTTNITNIFFDSDTANVNIFIGNIQLSQTSNMMPYTSTSITGGEFKFPIKMPDNATIIFDYFYYGGVSNTVISNDQYNYWWGIYHNASGYIYMHEAHDGTSYSPNNFLQDKYTWATIAISWDNTTQELYANGTSLGTVSTIGSANSANIPFIYLGNGWNRGNGRFKNLRIYNRKLTDIEIEELSNKRFNLEPTGDLHNNINTHDIPGWTKVYEGLCTQLMNETKHDGEVWDYYGESVLFDEMMVRSVYWNNATTMTTTETAKLKNSIKWYAYWLDTQPDSPAPQMLFHGTDDIQDVAFTTPSILFFGYGNSWRKIDLTYYVAGSDQSMYLGGTTSAIVNEDWETVHGGTTNYANYMRENYPKESGVYNLTPRQYQTIQIYVRLRDDGTKNTRMEVLDGVVNSTTIHTKEVL